MYLQIKRAIMASLLSMICFVAFAQQTVTGTVKDATGEPMIGVTVLLNGQAAAVTDIDGNFTIKAEPKDVVKVSYIGYSDQQVTVGNKTSLEIVLQEDSQTLNEVVVVGYGTMKKSDLTGSIGSVDTEKLTAKGAASVMEALQGSVPGVSITQTGSRAGGDFNIEIRGKSSINGDQQPLYVVDGVICSDIQWLNQQDIERIDILKDASSTAIYGSRATAGVVMVTTKSGTSVQKNTANKPSISYDGYYGWTKAVRMPDFQDAQEFYDYRFKKFLSYAGGLTQSTAGAQPNYQMSTFEQMALFNSTTQEYRLKTLLANGESYNWPDMVTRTGSQQNHFLTISGASDQISYHFGVGYAGDKGIYEGDNQSKVNFKGAVDANINKYVSAGFSMNMAKIDHDYANDNAIKVAYRMNPFMIPYDADGNINVAPGNYQAMGSSSSFQFSDQTSALVLLQNEQKNRETWRMMGNIYVNIKPMAGLNFKSTFSPNYTYYRQGRFVDTLDPTAKTTTNEAMYVTNRNFSWTWDNMLTYDKTFNDIHHINAMALISASKSDTESSNMDDLDVRTGTQWWNLGTGSNAGNDTTSYSENELLSYALRANYTLMDRYMLTATVRWDGSSRFGENHRWGSFPSVALAWRASEEEFMKKIDWISNLKLRLSYGVTGNNNGIGNYATVVGISGLVYYPFGNKYYNGTNHAGIVDELLKWEKSHEWNVGLDFGFLRNRISGSVDWYVKTSKDLLFEVGLPLETGGVNMTTNIGSVRNTGVEATVTGVIIDTKDWNWTVSASFAHNKNKVREINGTGDRVINGETTSLFIGQPVNNVYGYNWVGIVTDQNMVVPNTQIAIDKGFTPGETVKMADYYYATYGLTEGQPIIEDVNGDGTFNDDDKHVWSSDPKWTGSLNTSVSYKGWDLSASLYTKQKYTVKSNFLGEYLDQSDRGRMRLNADYYVPAGVLIDCDGINADGTYINPVYQETTHYGSYPFPNNGGDNAGVGTSLWSNMANTYVDASYWKIKNITLGYTFPKQWINKIGIQKLRLYCTVTNPFVWTDYKGFDPEWANAELRYDGPSTVTWQFGANIKF